MVHRGGGAPAEMKVGALRGWRAWGGALAEVTVGALLGWRAGGGESWRAAGVAR